MNGSDLDLIAISAGPSQVYFSGLHFHISERPAVLLIGANELPAFIFPEFETEKVQNGPISLRQFPYQEQRLDWRRAFECALSHFGKRDVRIGVEPTAMRFLEMDLLGFKRENISVASAGGIIAALRARKDAEELAHIRKAIHIAQTALHTTRRAIKVGVTEREIANALVMNLLREGSDPELPFFPIVAAGPNSANPHGLPSDRKLSPGDLLIIDWGARCHGYVSDITRTFAIGTISPKLKEIYQVVKDANQAARDSRGAGLTGSRIDQAARDLITRAGYGDAFLHRTGHGYGLEAHEAPYMSADNNAPIQPGNTFTIEPGIYLPGLGGVRIEDDMYAVDGELETLTTLDRDLITI